MIKGKLVVINGDSGRRSPRATALLQLSFFSVEKLRKRRRGRRKRGNKKMSQTTSSNFDRCLTWRFGCCCGRKIRRCQDYCNSTSIHRRRTTITFFFFIGDGDRKGNLGTKKEASSECMKTILFSILKSGYHIS